MKNKISIFVNLVGTFAWFFNYYMTGIWLFAVVALIQLFIAILVLTFDSKNGNINR